jgi:prepilin-type N-terminal cleavage/methylation domain-containing protein
MSNIRKSVAAARNNNDQGFTLVELLIVIIVLGILASIVVFGVAQFRTDAQVAACKADLKQVSTAADAFYAKNLAYPTAGVTELVDGKYLKAAPAASSAVTLGALGAVTSTVAGCTL